MSNSITDEISKQLSDSGATVVFGLASMSDILKKAIDVIQRPIKIVYVKEVESESLPSNGIDINELVNPKGEESTSQISRFSELCFRCRFKQFKRPSQSCRRHRDFTLFQVFH